MTIKVGGNILLIYEGEKTVAGKGTGKPAIVVGVQKKKPLSALSKREIIPKQINGKETDVIETDIIRALGVMPKEKVSDNPDRTTKWRPMPSGVSGGHIDITAGTLNTIKDKGLKKILSNNHVLANQNKGIVGDVILQPGAYDNGTLFDKIGTLEKFVPIEVIGMSDCPVAGAHVAIFNFLAKVFHRKTRLSQGIVAINNTVDCALAVPDSQQELLESILEVGMPHYDLIEAIVGLDVKKSGRTTGVTHGKVTGINGTAQVQFDDGIAIFTEQIVLDHMLEGGDSGSILLTEADNKFVGLCFAGSDTISLANKMSNVFAALEIEP